MPVVSVPTHRPSGVRHSKRVLALAGDGRLVEQMRRGNELAFEVAFERHGAALLGFCRHMLGSAEEAEDAVQHTFASAWRNLERGGDRELILRPWLFTIARNRCVSMLRARRDEPELGELATADLSEEVERRAELRELLADIGRLPLEQRESLLLSELGELPHTAVAQVLGCEVARVKSLVFRARSALIAGRKARAKPCDEIREQLANLRGGALRRNELRLHLRDCSGCREYRDEVRRQRELLAAALPVSPGSGFELSVLAAAGIGGAGAAIGGAGSMLLTKLALVGLLAGGGVAAERMLANDPGAGPRDTPPGVQERAAGGGNEPAAGRSERTAPAAAGPAPGAVERRRARTRAPTKRNGAGIPAGQGSPRLAARPGREPGRKLGHEKNAQRQARPQVGAPRGLPAQGRGPVESPVGQTPVKRGPVKVPTAAKPPPGSNPKPAEPAPQVAPSPPAEAGPPAEHAVGKQKPPKS